MLSLCQHLVLAAVVIVVIGLMRAAEAQRITIDAAPCAREFVLWNAPFVDSFRISIDPGERMAWRHLVLGVLVGNRSVVARAGAGALHSVRLRNSTGWRVDLSTSSTDNGQLTTMLLERNETTKTASGGSSLSTLHVDVEYGVDWQGCYGVTGDGVMTLVTLLESDLLASTNARGYISALCTHFQPANCMHYDPSSRFGAVSQRTVIESLAMVAVVVVALLLVRARTQ